jgi:eukaryotic-like serine/threonine-protein kinase
MTASSAETLDAPRSSSPREGQAPTGSSLFNIGGLIDGRYAVVRPIGRGGMGRVVEVERVSDRSRLALKYCDGSPLGRKRLIREARILGDLEHPHLLPVLDSNLDHDPPYFVMPLAMGTLESELRAQGGDVAWAISVFRQVCAGVQGLHHAGVVHRDLKPANILRMDEGRYVVADLGTGKREPRDSTILTRTCAILGTLNYLAPEQMLPGGSRQADARTDIFQLGKILYEMATGRSPAVLELMSLPRGLAHIVRRATAARPDDRYPEVSALLEAVENYHDSPGEFDAVHPGPTLERLSRLVERLIEAGHYRGEYRFDILAALADLDGLDPVAILDAFDRVPTDVLAGLAGERPAQFLAPLKAYAHGLEQVASRLHVNYADFVARRMKAIVQTSRDPEVKTRALQAILVVAVVLNRYAAMAVIKLLLYQIKDAETALPVAEMLRAHRDYFQEIAPGLRADRLHPILRSVLDELVWIETVSF